MVIFIISDSSDLSSALNRACARIYKPKRPSEEGRFAGILQMDRGAGLAFDAVLGFFQEGDEGAKLFGRNDF